MGKGFAHKSAVECGQFLEQYLFAFWPQGRLHLVLDNLSVHTKALRELPARVRRRPRRRLRLYWLPTDSSWLNLIEFYFSTLKQTGLDNTNYTTPDESYQ